MYALVRLYVDSCKNTAASWEKSYGNVNGRWGDWDERAHAEMEETYTQNYTWINTHKLTCLDPLLISTGNGRAGKESAHAISVGKGVFERTQKRNCFNKPHNFEFWTANSKR